MTPIPTPYLLIDADVVRRNIARLVAYADQHELAVRPHTKTHKSLLVARLQIEAGAAGLTVAKAGEAEVMAAADDDLLVAYPALDPHRAARLAHLAAHKTVRVAVDSKLAIETLAAAANAARCTLGLLVDLDVGMHRTGVQTPEAALALAEQIDRAAGLRLDGLFFYPGHIRDAPDAQPPRLKKVSDLLHATLLAWDQHGLEAAFVSGGSTPTAWQSHLVPECNEIRPGTLVYGDMNSIHGGYADLEECAASVVATVVSDAVPGQVVIDAGSKALTAERCAAAPESGFGYLPDHPEAIVTLLSEEHGQVDVRGCERPPQLGERIRMIPNHVCTCVNLHDRFWWQEPGEPPREEPVDARGALS